SAQRSLQPSNMMSPRPIVGRGHVEVLMLRQAVWLVVVLSMAITSRAAAQGTTSRVLGVVTDQTGAIVPGATVTLSNEATGVSFNTVTTGAGAYTFEAIQVGTYSLTV